MRHVIDNYMDEIKNRPDFEELTKFMSLDHYCILEHLIRGAFWKGVDAECDVIINGLKS